MSIDKNQESQAGEAISFWRRIDGPGRALGRGLRRALWWLLAGLAVVYFAFCALFLGLRYLVLPNIDHYKPQVEQWVSQAVGSQVSIADIGASWRGLNPNLLLTEVVIHDRAGAPALSLPRVSATVSWWSVAAAGLRLYTLEISAPDLDIERDLEGRFHVGSFVIDPRYVDGRPLDWAMAQREILVRNGRLRWKDNLRSAPVLELEQVELVMQNKWRRHRFAVKATPAPEFGARFDLRAFFQHSAFARPSDFRQWSGTVYADWSDTDLARWKPYVDYPFEVEYGRGALRAWLDFDHGRPANYTADLALSGLRLRLKPDLPWMELVRVDGRVAGSEMLWQDEPGARRPAPGSHRLDLSGFSFETADGLKLAPATISHAYWPARGTRPERNELRASQLDLRAMADLLGHLPLPQEQRQLLARLEPQGQLRDMEARWEGAWRQASSYHLRTRFDGFGLRQQPAREGQGAWPGFANLSGSMEASERGGVLRLASQGATLQAAGLLAEPALPFEQLNLHAKWSMPEPDLLQIQLENLDFIQDGMVGSASGRHRLSLSRFGKGNPGTLDLTARLSEFDLKRIGRYLPLQTPAGLHDWRGGALGDGKARFFSRALHGNLARFPFHAGGATSSHPQERFLVSARIDDGKMNYTPGHRGRDGRSPEWPLLENIKGRLEIDRTRLSIQAESARTYGVALSKVSALIPDMANHDAQLEITGTAAGPLQNFLRYTVDSPVAHWIDNFTADSRASGNARLALKLNLPLEHPQQAKVQGGLQFAGNDITLLPALPTLAQTSGELKFHEKGFELNGVRAAFLGGPVSVAGGLQADGLLAIRAEGALSAEGLRRAYPDPGLQRSLEKVRGGARYATQIRMREQRLELAIDSSLEGLALDFPAPLAKTAGERMPFRFTLAEQAPSEAGLRDEIRLALGNAFSAQYQRRRANQKDSPWQVVRGGIGINSAPPLPDSGVAASINLNSLDLDAWRTSAAGLLASAGDGARPAAEGLDFGQYIEADRLAVRAAELIVLGKKLDRVVLGASHRGDAWQANLDSEQASGYLSWHATPGGGLGLVTARLSALSIPQSSTSDVTSLLDDQDAGRQIPALDIVAERFQLLGRNLGRLELLANNASTPDGGEWQIRKLALENPDGSFNAEGKWSTRQGQPLSSLNFGLDIANAGRLLERFGFAGVLRGGHGRLDGEVKWKGLPYSFDLPSLSGQLHLKLDSGQFLKVEPGAAKLLGVLSLQSLPRRLALDFRDVFSEGFAFDGVVANANIAQGVMTTDGFKMRGVNAAVLLDGEVDIVRESQNLHAVIIPEVNFGAASVAYGLMVNPVIGLGSFLAQLFLRDPLMQAFTMEYQVSGPWKDPLVAKLPRKNYLPPQNPAPAAGG